METVRDAIWYHVVTVTPLLIFKLAVLFVGFLIAKLGHDLLIKGVTGQFKFSTELQGNKADLVSVSPGLFFILMSAILIAVAVIKDKPFETKVTQRMVQSGAEQAAKQNSAETKPKLPDSP